MRAAALRPAARSKPFEPAAVHLDSLFTYPCGWLFGCGCSQVEGRRWRGRARSWCGSARGHRDRDVTDMKALTAAGQVALGTILLHPNFAAGSDGAELGWCLVPFGAT
eukprot:COSAG02_NODE_1943_length_10309_cov_29.284721_2_plen_108_part_00